MSAIFTKNAHLRWLAAPHAQRRIKLLYKDATDIFPYPDIENTR